MATPVRFPSGVSTDQKWQPLADFNLPNPFDYHVLADDFDQYSPALYTLTSTNAGSAGITPADGGAVLLTTTTGTPTTTDVVQIQARNASFSILANKKTFFLARVRVSDVINSGFTVGLMNSTTTPFAPTDGVYFLKASGSSTNLTIVSTVSSVSTVTTIPTAAYTLVNGTDIDLAFQVDAKGVVNAYVGVGLLGFSSNSGTGLVNPNRGVVATIVGATITSVLTAPILSVRSSTATIMTLQADTMLAARER